MSPSTAILRPWLRRQQRQRRRHGSGIGVVAFVNHRDIAGLEARAAALEGREILQARRGVQHIAIRQRHRRQRAHHIAGDMGAGGADIAIHRPAQNIGLDPHAIAIRGEGNQSGFTALPKRTRRETLACAARAASRSA